MSNEAYLPTHEWAKGDAATVVVGLSPFAASEVGEVIFVKLPAVGQTVKRGTAMAEIESVKSVNDFYAPVDGVVTEVNAALAEKPQLVNDDPLGEGWFVKVKPAAAAPLAGLLSAAAYADHIKKK